MRALSRSFISSAKRDQHERNRRSSPVPTGARHITLTDYTRARERPALNSWAIAEAEDAARLKLTVEELNPYLFRVVTPDGKRLTRLVTRSGDELSCGCQDFGRAHKVGNSRAHSCEHTCCVALYLLVEEGKA